MENLVNTFSAQNKLWLVDAFFVSIKSYLKKCYKDKNNRRKMLPGKKKGKQIVFMCSEFIIVVLLEQQSPQVGKKS